MDLISFLIAIAVTVLLYFTQLLSQDRKPLFGIYSQTGKWYKLKYTLMLLLLRLRRMQKPKANKRGSAIGLGVSATDNILQMEQPQQLPDPKLFPNAVDAVYFNAADRHHNYLIMAASRRQNGIRQCISIIRLAGIGTLEHPQQPNTNFELSPDSGFENGEMQLTCQQPMQQWRLRYTGEMLLCNEGYGLCQPLAAPQRTGRRVMVQADLQWRALHPHFDFDTEQDLHVIAAAMAAESWSREFLHSLESLHQTHIEQFGEITGTVIIDNNQKVELRMQGARDHSFGNHREWFDLYRYGLQYVYLEDGSCLAVGCVSMPKYLSCLPIGFVCNTDGSVSPLRDSDFKLSNLGQDGRAPQQFSINCWAGGKLYHLQAAVADQCVFHMGTEQEARIYERFCDFEVNGLRGWGVSEWCYRNAVSWPAWANDS